MIRNSGYSEHTSGAMDKVSGKVQNANTHSLRGDKIMSKRTTVGQFKGKFNGMWMNVRDGSILRGRSSREDTGFATCAHGARSGMFLSRRRPGRPIVTPGGSVGPGGITVRAPVRPPLRLGNPTLRE